MKRTLLLNLFTILICSAFAQQINYGVMLGIDFSNMDFDGKRPNDKKIGPAAGFYVNHCSNKEILFQIGISYFNKGFTFPENAPYKGHLNLHYLSTPLLIGFQPVKNLSILLGLQPGYLVSGKYKVDSPSLMFRDAYTKFDFSAIGEIKYKIFKGFGIIAGYDHGLMKVYKAIVADQNGNVTGYRKTQSNRTFELNIIYELTKKAK